MLVGFESKYRSVRGRLRLLTEPEAVSAWSLRTYGTVIQACRSIQEQHPLCILSGDVGTGKTASALGIADKLCRERGQEGRLIHVESGIRGTGLHGDMAKQVSETFTILKREAGRKRVGILLVDEADAIGSERSTVQMHQEEKAGVNFLIQELDKLRSEGEWRMLVLMCTNREGVLDAAITRRAMCRLTFNRPTTEEAERVLQMELEGARIGSEDIRKLAKKMTEGDPGYSYSDIRTRWLPEALALVYPEEALGSEALYQALDAVPATPRVK